MVKSAEEIICDAKYVEHRRSWRVRETSSEPAYDEWDDEYCCNRRPHEGGDHHGPIAVVHPGQPNTEAVWPVIVDTPVLTPLPEQRAAGRLSGGWALLVIGMILIGAMTTIAIMAVRSLR